MHAQTERVTGNCFACEKFHHYIASYTDDFSTNVQADPGHSSQSHSSCVKCHQGYSVCYLSGRKYCLTVKYTS